MKSVPGQSQLNYGGKPMIPSRQYSPPQQSGGITGMMRNAMAQRQQHQMGGQPPSTPGMPQRFGGVVRNAMAQRQQKMMMPPNPQMMMARGLRGRMR